MLIYITGLSGSGKTTIGKQLQMLIPNSIMLDGDDIRNRMNSDLGFGVDSKKENIRRNNELIKLLYDQNFTIIACFMASIQEERDKVFSMCPDNIKVQLTTPIEECAKRDPKGLYAVKPENFAGFNCSYTGIENPDLSIDTSKVNINSSINLIKDAIDENIN